MIKFWEYLQFYNHNKRKILNNFNQTLLSGNLILGDEVKYFEKSFAKYIGVKYAIAVGNCTDALLIALKVLDLKNKSEVITVANTAVPTVCSIINANLIPIFSDINDFYLMDENKLEGLITKKTKVIMPVHLYGQPCNMKKIISIAKKYNLKVIEDCAQATGALHYNKKVGSFGDIGCFSFYPTKVLGGFGDSGMIVTNNERLYKKIKNFRFMGIDNEKKSGYAVSTGINSRMDDLQASILNFKLKNLDFYIKKRNLIAKFYNDNLDSSKFLLPTIQKNNTHVYYEYVIGAANRKKIFKQAKINFVELKITYPYLIYNMNFFRKYKRKYLPKSEYYSKKIFSLPIYPELNKSSLKKIVDTLNYI